MKEEIGQQVIEALTVLRHQGLIPSDLHPTFSVTRTKDAKFGDFATNVAMVLAKPLKMPPRDVAQQVINALSPNDSVKEVVIAGPGFINFFQNDQAMTSIVPKVLDQGVQFGRSDFGKGSSVQVEYVSANPTGPLHVGHGRGAALGATIANLLDATGFDVQREYYVNDAGRQMDILALSVWLRYLTRRGEVLTFPSNGYRGDYIQGISQQLEAEYGDRFQQPTERVFQDVAPDESQGGDKEKHIDALIARAKQLLGESNYRIVFDCALDAILSDIKQDLSEFGVVYDEWFSERSLSGDIKGVVDRLEGSGHLYVENGVTWFRSTQFGDDKDRAVVRANGQTTYFASDIAYIDNKMSRGFDRVLYIFGADHHGYTARLYAACEALGHDPSRLEFLLIQFANLYRAGERVQMSTRSGSFVTIRELRDEVGTDAARFFYVMRKYSQHLDFDLDLAKSQSSDNPVYYVQYAYARICSVLRQLEQRNMTFNQDSGMSALHRLQEPAEAELLGLLAAFPETVQRAAVAREPHQVTGYLRDLSNGLHSYYNSHKVLVDDQELRDARLCLYLAVRQVLGNGLHLLNVSTPEVM